MSAYSIAETMETIQGEGHWSGTPALFLRFAGCNMWSGVAEDRERDAARHEASCPKFCDTDFTPRFKMTADEIVGQVSAYAKKGGTLMVVTGGEPLLQLDAELLSRLITLVRVSVETNGTIRLSPRLSAIWDRTRRFWVTCSPKQAPAHLKLDPSRIDELKVVYPDYDPETYRVWCGPQARLYIQPVAQIESAVVGRSLMHQPALEAAAAWCMAHPTWGLSLQTHKLLGIP